MVFDKAWFEQHQKVLLFFVNTWIGKLFFRIYNDVPKGKKIIKLLPNCYTWKNENGSFTTDFRTHDKFGKRLYYGLKPVWHVMHFLDWLFLDKYVVRWSFGFATLTVYPVAGANSPIDGFVRASEPSGVSFSTLTGHSGTISGDDTTGGENAFLSAHSTTNLYDFLSRSIYVFDTSSLPDSDYAIDTAVLSLRGFSKSNSLGLSDAHAATNIVSSSPTLDDQLQGGDFDSLGSTRFSSDIGYSAFSLAGYNDYSLNAPGIANINDTGLSKFGLRFAVDIDNGTPAWANSTFTTINAYYADWEGTDFDPKLVINYYFTPSISGMAAGDADFYDEETNINVSGTDFEATQGAGKVELCDNVVYASGSKQEQTVTSWGDTAIAFTANKGSLLPGTLYVFVTDQYGLLSNGQQVTVGAHPKRLNFFTFMD
jgi:hypothetical protein